MSRPLVDQTIMSGGSMLLATVVPRPHGEGVYRAQGTKNSLVAEGSFAQNSKGLEQDKGAG
jgi:hypothetical protein